MQSGYASIESMKIKIIDKVRDTIRKYKLIAKGELVLVGVSGGPDSVCLLHLLKDLSGPLGFKLEIGHLDHMLRKDSVKDAEFVKSLAVKLGIPATFGRIDVKKLAAKGSLEEAARNARLKFLINAAKEAGAKKICLAHNLDDQAETVLMRILRGAGLYGLSGMLCKRKLYGFEIIRPLVRVERREIEGYLKSKKLKARIDPTNREEVFFRNRTRNRLIPLLEKEYNPKIKETLSNMAETIALDYDYLKERAMGLVENKRGRLKLKSFYKYHPAMQRLAVRLNICRLQGSTRRISFTHIKEIEDLALNRPVNSIVDLPKGISVAKKAKSIIFYRR